MTTEATPAVPKDYSKPIDRDGNLLKIGDSIRIVDGTERLGEIFVIKDLPVGKAVTSEDQDIAYVHYETPEGQWVLCVPCFVKLISPDA